MKTKPWSREALLHEVRDDFWRYLTPASSVAEEAAQAEALLKMPASALQTLGHLQFATSPVVRDFLDAVPDLLRQLPSTSTTVENESVERLEGPVSWARTFARRRATGHPSLFVTVPAERSYDTPEGRMVATCLAAIETAARSTAWTGERGTAAAEIRSVAGTAIRWSQSRMLLDIPPGPLTGRQIARVKAGRKRRKFQPAIDCYALWRALVRQQDRARLRQSIEDHALALVDPADLFEILVAFRALDAIKELGWKVKPYSLFRVGHLRAHAEKGDLKLRVSYQHTPSALGAGSPYVTVQEAHSIRFPAPLRPDLVLETRDGATSRWGIVECKGGGVPVERLARRAVVDLLAYRRAFGPALDEQVGPYGLGVVWGSGLGPGDAEIALATADRLQDGLEPLLGVSPH